MIYVLRRFLVFLIGTLLISVFGFMCAFSFFVFKNDALEERNAQIQNYDTSLLENFFNSDLQEFTFTDSELSAFLSEVYYSNLNIKAGEVKELNTLPVIKIKGGKIHLYFFLKVSGFGKVKQMDIAFLIKDKKLHLDSADFAGVRMPKWAANLYWKKIFKSYTELEKFDPYIENLKNLSSLSCEENHLILKK